MMRVHRVASLTAALLVFGGQVEAQSAAGTTRPPSPPPGATQATAPSAEQMGVSLKSIRRRLDQAPAQQPTAAQRPTAPAKGLRYDFFVDVLGKHPPIDVFQDFNLSPGGGVRWGGPTHQEVLDAMSPYWVRAGRPPGSGFDILAATRKKKK
jgi:hypothetical protein